jgi:hypothetical protein
MSEGFGCAPTLTEDNQLSDPMARGVDPLASPRNFERETPNDSDREVARSNLNPADIRKWSE